MQSRKKFIKAAGGESKAKIRNRKRSSSVSVAKRSRRITPSEMMAETKIPDATPGIIFKYAVRDEQALLAAVRYNRLSDDKEK